MGPFQNTVRASATAPANAIALAGPMSRPFQPTSMPSAGTVRASASSLTSRATTTSVGSSTGLPWPLAVSSSWRTASTCSGSNSESPISWPWAARKVKHMPPPTTRLSTRPRRLSSTSSLSETLLPPSTAVNGRSGSSSSRDSTLTSPASRRPA